MTQHKKPPTMIHRAGKSIAKSAGNDVSGFWMTVLSCALGSLYLWNQGMNTAHGNIIWVQEKSGSIFPGHFGPDAYGFAACFIPPLLLVLKKYVPQLYAVVVKYLPKSLGGGK